MSSNDEWSPSSGEGLLSAAESSPGSGGSFDELDSDDDDALAEASPIIRSIVPEGADIQAAAAALPVANNNEQPSSSPDTQGPSQRRRLRTPGKSVFVLFCCRVLHAVFNMESR